MNKLFLIVLSLFLICIIFTFKVYEQFSNVNPDYPCRVYLSDNDFIGFKSVFNSEMSNFRYNDLFEKNEILVINNTSDEIKDAVAEMYLKLSNQWVTKKEDDELQERFISLLQEGHYSYKTSAKIGISFLRKYKDLLDS